jgi:hypothetical protein
MGLHSYGHSVLGRFQFLNEDCELYILLGVLPYNTEGQHQTLSGFQKCSCKEILKQKTSEAALGR